MERLINSVPERDTLVHGDFHTRNIFVQGDELILIDMADTSTGHPLFELGSMYMSLVLMSRVPAKLFRQLVGLEKKQAAYFFDRVFEQRFSDIPSQEQKFIRQIVELFSYLRIISMVAASGALEKLPVFVRKLTLHSMRNSVKRLYFNKSDEVIGILERVAALF